MFDIQTFGGIDLVFVDASASQYFVVDNLADFDEKRNDIYVLLRSADGARLASTEAGQIDLPLVILPFGNSLDEAEARQLALEAVLISARNSRLTGTIVTYVEKDESNTVAKTWRVIGGQLKPVAVPPGSSGRLHGLQGKFVAPCVLNMVLTKN